MKTPQLFSMVISRQLEGFEAASKEHYTCRLLKSLYGLKQSLLQWCKRFNSFMVLHGFEKNSYDCCVYHSKLDNGFKIYLLLTCYMLMTHWLPQRKQILLN